MDQVILDLGSDTNVLPKQTWEMLRRYVLRWSPIQLCMENKQNIVLMRCLYGVTVDIEGASPLADFEVTEVVDDNISYLTLLGIDQPFDMDVVINLKKRKVTFERKSLKVVVPLDPTEGVHFTKPFHDFVEDDDDLDQIYKITMQIED